MHLGKKLASGGNLDRVTALKHSATRVNGDLKIEGRCVVGGVPISGVAAQSDGSGGSDDRYARLNHHHLDPPAGHNGRYAPKAILSGYNDTDTVQLPGSNTRVPLGDPNAPGSFRYQLTVESLLTQMLNLT